jgi:hypothetical protein
MLHAASFISKDRLDPVQILFPGEGKSGIYSVHYFEFVNEHGNLQTGKNTAKICGVATKERVWLDEFIINL